MQGGELWVYEYSRPGILMQRWWRACALLFTIHALVHTGKSSLAKAQSIEEVTIALHTDDSACSALLVLCQGDGKPCF